VRNSDDENIKFSAWKKILTPPSLKRKMRSAGTAALKRRMDDILGPFPLDG
jgi:hypothetical protein